MQEDQRKQDPNSLTKIALDMHEDLRMKMLNRAIDKLAEALTDASYDTLDLLHYPETDKKARAYRAIIIEMENKLANERARK